LLQKFWNPNVCFNFLDTFFTFVKRSLEREVKHKYGEQALKNIKTVPMTTLLLEWKPGMPVKVYNNHVHEDDPILNENFLLNFGKEQ
jgi:hypothetical protein